MIITCATCKKVLLNVNRRYFAFAGKLAEKSGFIYKTDLPAHLGENGSAFFCSEKCLNKFENKD